QAQLLRGTEQTRRRVLLLRQQLQGARILQAGRLAAARPRRRLLQPRPRLPRTRRPRRRRRAKPHAQKPRRRVVQKAARRNRAVIIKAKVKRQKRSRKTARPSPTVDDEKQRGSHR